MQTVISIFPVSAYGTGTSPLSIPNAYAHPSMEENACSASTFYTRSIILLVVFLSIF